MMNTKQGYSDDSGEMDSIGGEPIADFLPRPEDLVLREETVKVTLSLSRRSVEFFKREAQRQRVPYQRMIRALVDEYARRQER